MPELLLELLSEEIPARMQTRAAEDLKKLVLKGFAEAGLAHGPAVAHATPRRLTLIVEDVAAMTEAKREELKGPRTDAPAKALDGFLRKTGLKKSDLETRDDKKGQVYFAILETPGRGVTEVVAEVTPQVIASFPWPKSMRWGEGDLRWVRPLRGILCLLSNAKGATIPPIEIGGLVAGDQTVGHRFLARDAKTKAPKVLTVKNAADYEAQLKKASVILDAAARAKKIEGDARKLAKAEGLEVVPDPGLLRENAGLVEFPVVLMGSIDADFQALPPEVLQTSMREHQKFFSVRDPKSGRIVKFIAVANLRTKDKGAQILAGNERVLRARLSDARFFYENDLARPLEAAAPKLAAVTFHNRLGSQADRVARIRGLAAELAPRVGADPELVERAAALAKADLVSEMVYEFPELQGLMGRYYATAGGEAPEVAEAIEAHYAPLGPSDDTPAAPTAIAVALADKLDTLAGFWTVGEKPTGSGDPFALRRAALGVIRIVLENGLRLRLGRALAGHADRLAPDVAAEARRGEEVLAEGSSKTLDAWRDEMAEEGRAGAVADGRARIVITRRLFEPEIQNDLLAFMAERLKVWLRDPNTPGGGVRHDVIDAVYSLERARGRPLDDLTRLKQRIDALNGLIGSSDGADLTAAFKRANNILAAEEKKDGVEYALDPDPKLAEQREETALFKALDAAEAAVDAALKAEDDAAAMAALAKLRAPLDAFFEKVTVNAESGMVRRNRLCLLHRVRVAMGRVADFSALEG